jgi:hypothetical protein
VAVAKPLHLRLFLEGQEVPVIAAQVSVNPNAPAAASIQVIPLDEVMDLRARTMVHLFFLDTSAVFKSSNEGPQITGQTGTYKLLFCGEVVGFSFVKTPVSRSIVLQCLDHSSYWDAAHATAIEYGPGGNAFTEQSAIQGSNNQLFDDIMGQQANRLAQWIREQPQTPGLTKVSGLAGGVIRVLEAIGGLPNAFKGINDFFTIAQLRCRVLEQISAEEGDDTASKLLSNNVFNQWLMHGLQNIGQQVTFRDILKLLFNYIYYEVVPNPAAKFDDAEQGKSSKLPDKKIDLRQTVTGQRLIKSLDSTRTVLNSYRSREPEVVQGIAKATADSLQDLLDGFNKLGAASPSAAQVAAAARADVETAINSLRAIDQKTPQVL